MDTAPVAAVDATGLETRHVSACFGMRRADGAGHRQRAWPKLAAAVHAHSHLILAAVPGVGPSPESPDLAPAMRQGWSPSTPRWRTRPATRSTTTACAARSWVRAGR